MNEEFKHAYQHGSQQAQRELRRLKLDLSQRVEIFDVIEQSGVWLMFQPLDKLFGLYERISNAAGIVLHAGHPLALQRFTGAHEYGHYVLGHEGSLDEEHDIESSPEELPAEEAAAQAFAANFLMPLQLVNRTLSRVGLSRQPDTIAAEQVYELSLLFGTSYQATINQLWSLRKIDWRQACELRETKPIDIKTRIAAGRRPENARADVWRVGEKYDGEKIVVRVEDEIHVALPENPSTGARWLLLRENDQLTLLGSWREPDNGDRVYGRSRLRHLSFRANEPGNAALSLGLARPQNARRRAHTFELHVAIAGRRTGESDYGVSEHQHALLAA